MANSANRDWKTVAQLAAAEQDPGKLFELVTELNKILEEQQRRIQDKPLFNRGAGFEAPAIPRRRGYFPFRSASHKINNHGFVTHEASA